MTTNLYWFRKALRVHDNPSLCAAALHGSHLAPFFVLDPHFRGRVGPLRWNHLIESLIALNKELESMGSALVLLEGQPESVFRRLFSSDECRTLCYEKDWEPYSRVRDAAVNRLAEEKQVELLQVSGHTLFDFDVLRQAMPVPATTYGAFLKKFGSLAVAKPLPALEKLPPLPRKLDWVAEALSTNPAASWWDKYSVPLLEGQVSLFRGGERVALEKMRAYCAESSRVATFEKPKTDPTKSWPGTKGKDISKGATTALSPYLHFGSLSPRTFYWALKEAEAHQKKHSLPPVSLIGQLFWREFFHFVGAFTENFDRIEGNQICRQIAWRENDAFFQAWRTARTGFPWIDAIMTQLRNEGWIHHLARHCVACFLTRGDLYLSWRKGVEVFDEYLVDADWSLNNANWMWLSCSSFFNQYWKVYSPVAFGKHYDKEGAYIKKYLPVLANYPAEYIYEPWKAPIADQKKWKCRIGEDYPKPIVKHEVVSKECIASMKKWFAEQKKQDDGDDDDC